MAPGLQEMTVKTAIQSKARTRKIEVVLSDSEKAEIETAAAKARLAPASWLRSIALQEASK
jgi:hypothetical protein